MMLTRNVADGKAEHDAAFTFRLAENNCCFLRRAAWSYARIFCADVFSSRDFAGCARPCHTAHFDNRCFGGKMIVWLGLLCLLLSVCFDAAMAETAIERGDYLVNTILACGNCHTPREANGAPIKDGALSGGRLFNTPAFVVTTSNITPDVETGIGSWSDKDVKRALIEAFAPTTTASQARRSRRSCPPTSTRRCYLRISTPSSRIC